MKRRLLAMLLLLLLLPTFALAGRQYIIPDSDTRDLTAQELWGWDYESLGYILNEIFARHGYVFNVGGKYDHYFRQWAWYVPNQNPNNSEACYPQLSSLEWRNEKLVKTVREQMRAQGTTNAGGKHYLDEVGSDDFDVLSGFTLQSLQAGQQLAVYAAPSTAAYRGANGKALVSTNGPVYVAGWESGWLLVMYETNKGAVRVGYVDPATLKGRVDAPMLHFVYLPATCVRSVPLTDDPARTMNTLRMLAPGETVTYLSTFQNRQSWAYVETMVDGQWTRGFIAADALGADAGLDAAEDAPGK